MMLYKKEMQIQAAKVILVSNFLLESLITLYIADAENSLKPCANLISQEKNNLLGKKFIDKIRDTEESNAQQT